MKDDEVGVTLSPAHRQFVPAKIVVFEMGLKASGETLFATPHTVKAAVDRWNQAGHDGFAREPMSSFSPAPDSAFTPNLSQTGERFTGRTAGVVGEQSTSPPAVKQGNFFPDYPPETQLRWNVIHVVMGRHPGRLGKTRRRYFLVGSTAASLPRTVLPSRPGCLLSAVAGSDDSIPESG